MHKRNTTSLDWQSIPFFARMDASGIARVESAAHRRCYQAGAVIFNEIPGAFSDACNKAIENGKPRIFRDDWLGVFEPAEIAESIRRIT